MIESANPYAATAPTTSQPIAPNRSSFFVRAMLAIIGSVLLFRGILIAYEYSRLFIHGYELNSYFSASMFCKDSITSLTGLVGGVFIFRRRPVGWWAGMMHCVWFLIWNVIVIVIADQFGWRMPVRSTMPGALYRIFEYATMSTAAIGFLALIPTLRGLRVATDRRFFKLGLIFVGSMIAALFLNWLSGVR